MRKNLQEYIKKNKFDWEGGKFWYWENQIKIIIDEKEDIFVWTVETHNVGNAMCIADKSLEDIKAEVEHLQCLEVIYKIYKAERKELSLKDFEEEMKFYNKFASGHNIDEQDVLGFEYRYNRSQNN